MPPPTSRWWQTAVVYQIYPRSFRDTSGNGVGDLEGIRRGLDHLAWLGVDALWISPFFRSPMKDFGYDVADYCDVDPLFGTLEDFDRLVADAHARGLRVLVDWVPNHSSDEHPWFVESRSSRDSAKRDWYVWRDGTPDAPPTNWLCAFTNGSAWTWDEATRQWYLHYFLPEQPDLNWANAEVAAAMQDTLRFWLDRGVDGFRMDVINCIGKDPVTRDVADPNLAKIPYFVFNDDERTHPLLRDLRVLLDGYDGDRVMVGELTLMDAARVARYYGRGDELHLAFNFRPLYGAWEAPVWREQIGSVSAALDPVGAWPTWVLSNHDNRRHRTRFGSEARARAAAVLLLGLRGTPFLYAGEELGLEDAEVPESRRVDPGGGDGCRAPVPWSEAPPHGWASPDAWLPWPPDAGPRSAEALRSDPDSILHLYRRVLTARRASPALRQGSLELLDAPDGVLAWRRAAGPDVRSVAVNFTGDSVDIPLSGTVEVASDGEGEGDAFPGRLGPDRAVVLR